MKANRSLRASSLFYLVVGSVDELGLECVPEAFHRRVVELGAEGFASVLRPAILSVGKTFGTAGGLILRRLWRIGFLTPSSLFAVEQAALLDGLSFDAFTLKQDGLSFPEIDIGRRQVVDALVISPVIVVFDEGRGEGALGELAPAAK